MYASSSGASECNNCLQRTSSFPGSTECLVCDKDYYRWGAEVEATPEACIPCPAKGASCPMDTTIETIVVHPGHWRLFKWSWEITACEGDNATQRCVGSSNANGFNSSGFGDDYCGRDYTGPECKICRGGRGLHLDRGECKKCPDIGPRVALLVCLIVAVAAALALTLAAYFHPAGQRIAAVRSGHRTVAWLMSFAKSIGLQAKFKVPPPH